MVQGEKIKKVNGQISEELWKEIKYAQDNLNAAEKKKNSGTTKKRWTYVEASDKLGKLLKSKRKNKQ